ncbi:MAG: lysine--tRNA ligase, partial [bacterium]|nr:lysine--tRNA ligase [bacterium]
HGKLVFMDVTDFNDKIQLAFKLEEIGQDRFEIVKLIDAGDYIEAEGNIFTTKSGEITILIKDFNILSKAIRPQPEQSNFIDKELRLRKRYLDLLLNKESRKVFDSRHKITRGVRDFLNSKNYTEVETPILQPLYGGANAKPFTTNFNALSSLAYLRIAPELYLKRLVVGGMGGVYELARNFRNEGIDQTHYPEFTMLEVYIPYYDYQGMMDTMEEMLKFISNQVLNLKTVKVGEKEINLDQEWPRVVMTDLIEEKLGIKIVEMSKEEILVFAEKNKVKVEAGISKGELIFKVFDDLLTDALINPTWIIDYPQEVSPLSKAHRSKGGFTERFELYVGGKEIMDGWSELNNAVEQRERFEAENYRKLDETESAQPLDEDFLESMEYGMPPFAGVGVGIDRLTMFFTNTWAIQETILFPFKKSEQIGITPEKEISENLSFKLAEDGFQIEENLIKDHKGISFAYAYIKDLKIDKSNDKLKNKIDILINEYSQKEMQFINDSNPIKAYREIIKSTGTKITSNRPSPEALLRRVIQGKGLYEINTAVDAYNEVVLKTQIGLGGFDLSKIETPVKLRYSKKGEKVLLLGDTEETELRDGQLVYSDENGVMTIDLNYRDANRSKITTETKDLIIFADGAPGITEQEILKALKLAIENIVLYCGGKTSDIFLVKENISTTKDITNNTESLDSEQLLNKYIKNEALINHSRMVAKAMKAYAKELNQDENLWYETGLLHDLDWEMFPDEHPNKAINELLVNYSEELKSAIAAHAPERTGKEPETLLDKYLYACDELSGLMNAISLMRPNGFSDMEVKSVKKKLKDKTFAANVSREDINKGVELIGTSLEEHIQFLINVFSSNSPKGEV